MTLIEKYQRFTKLKSSGLKAQARELAAELIKDYQSSPDYEFVLLICEECSNSRIDHIVWSRIVFPTLENRISYDPRAIRAMIKTIGNLYSSKTHHKRLNYLTEGQLLSKLLEINPEDTWAKEMKINDLCRWLAFTIHEYERLGIVLYGMDGASIDQCEGILATVDYLLALDDSGASNLLCEEVREKTIQYKEWLLN